MFSFDHPSLSPLLGAAGMYASAVNTRLEPRARDNLKLALRWCASNNRSRDYGALLNLSEKMPAETKARMLSVLHGEADQLRYEHSNGRRYNAAILTYPLVIESDDPPSDLDAGTIADIQKTLRQLGVTGQSVSVEVLPWLLTKPVHVNNPISRLRLLQRVLDVVITRRATERYASTSTQYSDPMANLSLLPARPEDAPMDGEPGAACMRFLTLVVVSAEAAQPMRVSDETWLQELVQIIWRHGRYRYVQGAGACFTASEALTDATLDLACLRIADFMRSLEPLAEDWPGQCSMVIRLKHAEDPSPSSMAISCIHQGQALARTCIELPGLADEQERHVEELASAVARQAAQTLDIAAIVVAGSDPRANILT